MSVFDGKNRNSNMFVVKVFPPSGRAYVLKYGDEKLIGIAQNKSVDYKTARQVIDALNQIYPPRVSLYVGRKSRSVYKVGIAVDLTRRATELGIEIIATQVFDRKKDAIHFERKLHTLFKMQGKHVRRELFKLTDEDVQWLSSLRDNRQWDNEKHLDGMIEEAKRKLQR